MEILEQQFDVGHLQLDDMRDEMCPKEVPYPPLKSPNYFGAPSELRTRPLAEEEVGPDEIPPNQLMAVEVAANTNTANPPSASSSKVIDWNFPRTPEVKIGPPREGANATSDVLTRQLIRDYIMYGAHGCWICGSDQHALWHCEDDEEHEGQQIMECLNETIDEDLRTLGEEEDLRTLGELDMDGSV